MNSRISIALDEVQQTLLITLGGRADEARLPDSLLRDSMSIEAARKLDFDFANIKLSHDGLVALAVRAHTLDRWIERFVQNNPGAQVVHMGCGLDSRAYRVDLPESTTWWEVDFPEVIKLRRNIYPKRDGHRFVERSVLEADWMNAIDDTRPTIFVAEGMFAYFTNAEVVQVLQAITSRFPKGEVVFDAYNNWGVWFLNQLPSIRSAGAKLRFALNNPRQLEREVPGLQLVEEQTGAPKDQQRRASLVMRWSFRAAQIIGPLRRMGQLLRYQWGESVDSDFELGRKFTK